MARALFVLLLLGLALHANAQPLSKHQSIINMEKKTIKQDAGRKQLGDFAPKFAELNDDVLFGQVWNRQDQLSLRDRSLITVVALVSMGMTDSSLTYHLQNARLPRHSPTLHSTPVGPRHGQPSVRPKRCGPAIPQPHATAKLSSSARWYSP